MQILCSIDQITTEVHLSNELVLRNRCKYRHKLNIAAN